LISRGSITCLCAVKDACRGEGEKSSNLAEKRAIAAKAKLSSRLCVRTGNCHTNGYQWASSRSSPAVVKASTVLGASISQSTPIQAMLRSTLRRSTRLIKDTSRTSFKPRTQRRYASTGHGEHAKSSDLPWAIPSLAITVPLVHPPPHSVSDVVCVDSIDDSQDGGRSSLGETCCSGRRGETSQGGGGT
jgi:hypothetical protein